MTQAKHPIINVFKILHILGLILLIAGLASLLMTNIGQNVTGMVVISSLIGLGLVLISPFPIALVFQWASNKPKP